MSPNQNRPIVYSARYYSLTGKPRRQIYSHLYRINPNGTGRQQITDSPFNDSDPRWSPDGKHIAFIRRSAGHRTKRIIRLCIYRLNGSISSLIECSPDAGDLSFCWVSAHKIFVQIYHWKRQMQGIFVDIKNGDIATKNDEILTVDSDFDEFVCVSASPDGHNLYVSNSARIIRVADVKATRLVNVPDGEDSWMFDKDRTRVYDGVWVNSDCLVGLLSYQVGIKIKSPPAWLPKDRLLQVNAAGQIHRCVQIIPAPRAQQRLENADCVNWRLARIPGRTDAVLRSYICWKTRWYLWLLVDLATGRAEPWAEAMELAFSGDGRQFVTSYNGRMVSNRNYHDKVYVCPLRIADTANPEKQNVIVDGDVWVTSADWQPL